MKRSWWVKLDRAQEHLDELKVALAPFTAGRVHTVSKRMEPKNKPDERWVYRIHVKGTVDDAWAGIAGDFVANVRSALDHLALALNPPRNKHKLIYFPILEEDPWRLEQGTRKYVERDATNRRNFRRWTRDMDPSAAAGIKAIQPYIKDPGSDEYVLLTMKRLNNSDKHRQLLFQAVGFREGFAILTHPDGLQTQLPMIPEEGWFVHDGAVVTRLPDGEVEMQFIGTVGMTIGKSPNAWYEMPALFDTTLEYVREIVTILEKAVKW